MDDTLAIIAQNQQVINGNLENIAKNQVAIGGNQVAEIDLLRKINITLRILVLVLAVIPVWLATVGWGIISLLSLSGLGSGLDIPDISDEPEFFLLYLLTFGFLAILTAVVQVRYNESK